MDINNLEAVGEFVFVIKNETETKKYGLELPEIGLKKPNTGIIHSVGENVLDKRIKKGRTAVFQKQVGNEIELFDTEITVINGNQQIFGVL